MFADELNKMEVKFKEQLKINENLKLQLAAEEDRYKVNISKHTSCQLPTEFFLNAGPFFRQCMSALPLRSSFICCL